MRKTSTSKRKVLHTPSNKDVDRLDSPSDDVLKRIFNYAKSHKVVKCESVGNIEFIIN